MYVIANDCKYVLQIMPQKKVQLTLSHVAESENHVGLFLHIFPLVDFHSVLKWSSRRYKTRRKDVLDEEHDASSLAYSLNLQE